MKPYWQLNGSELYQGHVLDVLRALTAGSVQCCITSPPYWGLRDYGLPPVEWPTVSYAPMAGLAEIEVPGCDPECEHVWGEALPGYRQGGPSEKQDSNAGTRFNSTSGQFCQLCGGWRGSLGLEPTIEAFVGHLVLVCRELKRVLRDDGVFFCNLGDSYAQNGGKRATKKELNEDKQRAKDKGYWSDAYAGYKGWDRSAGTASLSLPAKNLIGVPWRVALALQADGWYLRSDIIWAKGVSFCPTYSGSCMPESVRDRPTTSFEHVFLLAKSKKYYYDAVAVREPLRCPDATDGSRVFGGSNKHGANAQQQRTTGRVYDATPGGRNLRSVWTIGTGAGYKKAHFATFPPALVEPMILAGTSQRGACPSCGAPWERVTHKKFIPQQDVSLAKGIKGSGNQKPMDKSNSWEGFPRGSTAVQTVGWQPTCTCDTAKECVPCVILDPFLGSGTTAAVARQLGRQWIGIELSQEYCDEHIIPRLEEPLLEWAEQEPEVSEPRPVQMGLL